MGNKKKDANGQIQNNGKKRSEKGESKAQPKDGGIRKKRNVRNSRLFPRKNDEEHKEESQIKKNVAHQRRKKALFYIKSTNLPISENTLKRSLCQLHTILIESGMLEKDDEIYDKSKNKSEKNRSMEKFWISKEALQYIQALHAHYMGNILSSSQTICYNVKKKTVKSDILDLSRLFTNEKMGPQWNMKLVPISNDSNQ